MQDESTETIDDADTTVAADETSDEEISVDEDSTDSTDSVEPDS